VGNVMVTEADRPDGRMRPTGHVALRLIAASLAATAFSSCGGSPVLPTQPACLDRAVFGVPAESPYVLPYPVGEAYTILQAYCPGQLIARAGSSGTWVPCPSCAVLHFEVFPTANYDPLNDVAVSFRNADGPLDGRGGLIEGAAYTALPH